LAQTRINGDNKASWAAVRKELELLDRTGLLALVQDLYNAKAANRRFLEARFLSSSISLEKYRRLVADAVYPDPFSRRPVSIRDATMTITEYRRSTSDVAGTVDLILTFLEAGTEQAAIWGMATNRSLARSNRNSTRWRNHGRICRPRSVRMRQSAWSGFEGAPKRSDGGTATTWTMSSQRYYVPLEMARPRPEHAV
jgi:hypothetical protein